MNKEKYEWMPEEVAHRNGIAKEKVRQEMQEAMEEGIVARIRRFSSDGGRSQNKERR